MTSSLSSAHLSFIPSGAFERSSHTARCGLVRDLPTTIPLNHPCLIVSRFGPAEAAVPSTTSDSWFGRRRPKGSSHRFSGISRAWCAENAEHSREPFRSRSGCRQEPHPHVHAGTIQGFRPTHPARRHGSGGISQPSSRRTPDGGPQVTHLPLLLDRDCGRFGVPGRAHGQGESPLAGIQPIG